MKNRKIGAKRGDSGLRSGSRPNSGAKEGVWLYGTHAVLSALANPNRKFLRLCATSEGLRRLEAEATKLPANLHPEPLEGHQLARLLPPESVHQGVALLARPLAPKNLADIAPNACLLLALDQVSDPRNVGAILRSAAVFGADAVLTTERKAATESGALAKAASGGLELVPRVAVGNLGQALRTLKQDHDFWVCALASQDSKTPNERQTTSTLEQATQEAPARLVLVLGAEGKGVRPLVAKQADLLVRIPTAGLLPELNVSNAAAVALYAFCKDNKCKDNKPRN